VDTQQITSARALVCCYSYYYPAWSMLTIISKC